MSKDQGKVMEVVRRVPLQKKKCPYCGKEFWGQSARKFCSPACRDRAAYWRNPEKYRQHRMNSYRKKKGEA